MNAQAEILNYVPPEEFLREAKIVSLLSVWMLVAFFYYLNRHTKRAYFTIWTAGWMFYGFWLTLNWQIPDAKPGAIISLFEEWCLAFSAVFLLWGSLRFLKLAGRPMLFILFMLFLGAWMWTSRYVFSTSGLAMELPVFVLIALCSAFAGLCFFRLRMRMPFIGAGMLSLGLQLWALYLASYPVLKQHQDIFTADFYIGTVLQVFLAASMIVLVLEEVRLNAEEVQGEIETVHSEKEELLARALQSEEKCRNLYNQVQLSEGVQKAYDELRRTQEGMAQKERLAALGQMASAIAHDVNNALSPILGYTDLLLNKMCGIPDEVRKYLGVINQASDAIAVMVARMRDFYRQRSDPSKLAEVNIHNTVEEVIEMTRPRWHDIPLNDGIQIKMQYSVEPEMPPLYVNPDEFKEGLLNLIFNAVDALPGGGIIKVAAALVDVPDAPTAEKYGSRQLRIEVRDNGVGMDEKTRQRCLEPFFSTKGSRGGSGLGLPMVYGMMQRHEGTIQIESTRSIGTCVKLTFPLRKPVSSAEKRVRKHRDKRSVKVLCIDDDPPIQELLDVCLTHFGHQVAVATSGKQGLEMFRLAQAKKQPYEVVITDMGMPDLDGYQVVDALSGESRHTPIIMMTGWGAVMREENSTPVAVRALIDKPPRIQELNDLVLEVTEKNGSNGHSGEGH